MPRRSLILPFLLLALAAQAEDPPSPKVIERYRQMLDKNPAEGTALDRLWKAYLDQNQTGQLLEEYQAAGTFSSELVLGHLFKKAARTDNALAAFDRAAKLDPANPLAPLATARLRLELGQQREAAEAFEKAVALLPADDARLSETLLQLGAARLAAGDPVKAAESWERTVALNPTDLDLRRRLAETYAQNRLIDRAVVHLEYVEKHAPPAERALALQQVARLQQGAGNQDAAIAALEKALALTAPGNWLRAELASQLIRLHQRYHRTAELEERWKKFAADNPRDLGACVQLIDLYERLGELEAQRTWLQAASKLAPKNPDYRLKLARLAVRMDEREAAAELYDKLLAEQPANVDFVFERARLDLQRDAAPAARQRIAALLTARKDDETVRARALEFYQQNRLFDLVEHRLTADAAAGDEDAITSLATFLFTQRRDAEARRILQRLVIPGDPAAKRAQAHFRLSQILKAQNDFTAASTELAAAVQLAPESREFQLAMGEMHMARADFPAAQASYAHALRVSRTDAEREQADQKLFESFRNAPAPPSAPAPPRSRPAIPELLVSPATESSEISPALAQQFTVLERDAAAGTDESGWLRLARWRLWNREAKPALDAAQKALALNPKSAPAYEILVRINTTTGPSPVAVFNLARLAEVDPANRASYQRRAGQLELQAGRIKEALEIFERLAKANPGNLEALTDLALTQQRAERWPEALASWRQVYTLSPVSRKKESYAPLLLTLERLNMHQPSAELQLKAIETEADQRQQFALFADLLEHCGKHQLLGWLRTQFEQRRKVRADDYFTEMALGRILKATGDRAAAFEVLADASFAAENPAEALPQLVREAEDLRKLDAAVQLQERLLRIVPQENTAGLEKLAELQERNLEIDSAVRTWDRLLALFPRDPAALGRAIEFQMRWGTPPRAAELLRKARALDPANIRTLASLAELDVVIGHLQEAEECLEQILRETQAEQLGDAFRFPTSRPTDTGRAVPASAAASKERGGLPSTALRAVSSFWVEDSKEPATERDQRLQAIRQLAQIIVARKDPDALAAWIKRWQAGFTASSESLWALYYAGQSTATLDRLEAIITVRPQDEPASQAFVWLALQSSEFTRLSAWLRDRHRTISEREYLFTALDQYLDQDVSRSDTVWIEKLFPPADKSRLMQVATLFANRNRFREASILGRRFFDESSTQRGICGHELARWYLLQGDLTQARTILAETIKIPADSFASPVCDALRDYYLLLPETARPAFVESYLAEVDATANPIHALAATVLLRGLSGDDAAARAALDKIVEQRPLIGIEYDDTGTPAGRRWRFLLQAGTQLQSWRLERLTMYLWEKALEDDALIELQDKPVQNLVRDLRQQLCTLHVAYDSPIDAQPWIEAYLRIAPTEGLISLVAALNGMNANVAALSVCRQLWEGNLGDADALRSLLNTCRVAGDEDTAEEVLWKSLGDGPQRLKDADRREFTIQLSEILERKGEIEQARTVLAEAIEAGPNDARVVFRYALINERAGRIADAELTYRHLLAMEPGNIGNRIAFASLLEKERRLPEAIALFPKGCPPEGQARLAVLLARNRQPEDALAALEGLPVTQQAATALSIATEMGESGERKLARDLIQSTLIRGGDARTQFPLQAKLVELLLPEDGAPAALRGLRRLRQLAIDNPGELLGSFLDVAAKQSTRLNVGKDFAGELAALWAEGAGPVPAGVTMLGMQVEAGEHQAAEITLAQLVKRDDAWEAPLLRVAETLETAKLPELLCRTLRRLMELDPVSEQPALRLVRTLQQMGKSEEARAVLEPLAARGMVSDDLPGKVARVAFEMGNQPLALQLYAEAVRRDPFSRNPEILLEAAKLQIAARDYPTARKTLRRAFANPANRRYDAIIDWLVAAEKIERFDAAAAEFDLGAGRLVALRRALFAYFDRGSQSGRALALFEAHPEIWQPGMAGRLREFAREEGNFAPIAVLLEKVLAQSGEAPDLSLAIARLYGDWAASELLANQPDAALGHLRKARERRPDIAEFAFRLSALQATQGDRRGAIQTLQTFLAVARDPAEIEQARDQLSKLRTGG